MIEALFAPEQLATAQFKPRPYQSEAIDIAVKFFNSNSKKHGIVVLPTGSGKSIVIANIAKELEGNTIVFQPSKEILEQNYAKFISYGYRASIYSASAGQKRVDKVTFATIGSVIKKQHLFKSFKNIIIDECFPYDQHVCTEFGKMKIGSIVNRLACGKEVPRVISYNEKSGSIELKEIIAGSCQVKAELIELKFSKNLVVKTTKNHPFLTSSGWVNANDLKEGQCVLTTKANGTYSYMPNNDQKDLILGSILGDGSVDKTRKLNNINRFRFIQGDDQKSYLEWKAKTLGCKISEISKNGFAGKKAWRFNTRVMVFNDSHCTKEFAIENINPKSLAISWMDDGHLTKHQNNGQLYAAATCKTQTELLSAKLKSIGIENEVRTQNSQVSGNPYYYLNFKKDAVEKLCEIIAPFVHPSMSHKIIDSVKHMAGEYQWNENYLERGGVTLQSKTILGDRQLVFNIQVKDNETYAITASRFSRFNNDPREGIIVHNCHLVNSKGGMYNEFIHAIEDCKVLGLTATPYRLSSSMEGAMLKFLTRTRPRIFSDVLYVVQNSVLFNSGFLAKLEYFSFDVIDRKMLQVNTSGTDFTEASLRAYYRKIDFPKVTAYWANRLLAKRKNLLVFSTMIEEANKAARLIPGAVVLTGATEKNARERILSDFKAGRIKCVINVGVLTTGFDFPALEAVLIARSTMSLALYYQIVGRAMRIHPDKQSAWIVDIGGNINFFGKIETLQVTHDSKGLWCVKNNGRQLTNVEFSKY